MKKSLHMVAYEKLISWYPSIGMITNITILVMSREKELILTGFLKLFAFLLIHYILK
jgi:hypothetical protein